MSDALRAALEAAHREVWPRAPESAMRLDVPIYEKHVSAYLAEKAGEELMEKIESATDDGFWGTPAEKSPTLKEFNDLLKRHLSPLFAALRVRAEEAENATAEMRAECGRAIAELREAEAREAGLRERARKALEPSGVSMHSSHLAAVQIIVRLEDALREIGGER